MLHRLRTCGRHPRARFVDYPRGQSPGPEPRYSSRSEVDIEGRQPGREGLDLTLGRWLTSVAKEMTPLRKGCFM
jgi:hypothetical protein